MRKLMRKLKHATMESSPSPSPSSSSSSNLRIRLLFGNGVLTKSQKNDGLRRSWLLLKPHFQTFSDVVSYILNSFDLFHSCPHGIILSMEGFVIPEFESTSMLQDKDLISVKRKEVRLINANNAIEEAKTSTEDETSEKHPIVSRVKLLTNEEFNEEAGSDQIETDNGKNEVDKRSTREQHYGNEDLASKKRKASSTLENSKKKRKQESIDITSQKKHPQHCERITKLKKKRKHENRNNENPPPCPGIAKKCTNGSDPESNSESDFQQNKEDTTQAPGMSGRPKKGSRSSRRKRMQRIIKRSFRELNKMDEQSNKQPAKDATANTGSKKDIAVDEDSDADGELVPVEVRPGRIRYVPSGKVKDIQQANGSDDKSTQTSIWEKLTAKNEASDVAKDAQGWNGITSKRKGQNWGREKQPSSWDAVSQPTPSWNNCTGVNGRLSTSWGVKSVDYDKLLPLIDSPKAGDIVAYRVLQLSSSCCPELSSFRIGKITSYDPESNKVKLVPLPEYPFNIEKKANHENGAGEQPLGFPVYNDDGSLETDFTSLNDVRIVKLSNSILSVGDKLPTANGNCKPSTSKWADETGDDAVNVASEVSNQELHAASPANGKKDVWEEIAEALTAKKARLKQEDKWNKKETPVKRPWSFRSARNGANGPFMARLRGQQNGV